MENNNQTANIMDKILISKKDLQEWCNKHMDIHMDWTGCRVETVSKMYSVEEFVDKLYDYLKEK